MYCYIMQPWKTIRASSVVTSVTQTENCWLDLTPYQDIVAWLEVKEVSVGGGTNVQMAYQTSPTKDDSLFQGVVAAFNVATGVTTTVMLKDSATITLCRWLRWQLTVTGSPSSTWDAVFRIFIAANVVGRGGRTKVGAATVAPRPAGSSGPAGLSSAGPSAALHKQRQPGLLGYAATQPTTFQGTAAVTSTFQGTPAVLNANNYANVVPQGSTPLHVQASTSQLAIARQVVAGPSLLSR
jgi:hypothetical protein